jgi:hypothetical protein
MKWLITSIAVAGAFILLAGASCKKLKDDSALQEAYITGFDGRACICCGGYMINFDGETKPYSGNFYLIDNDLSSFGINASSVFPLKVKVAWTVLEKCSGKYINISKLMIH